MRLPPPPLACLMLMLLTAGCAGTTPEQAEDVCESWGYRRDAPAFPTCRALVAEAGPIPACDRFAPAAFPLVSLASGCITQADREHDLCRAEGHGEAPAYDACRTFLYEERLFRARLYEIGPKGRITPDRDTFGPSPAERARSPKGGVSCRREADGRIACITPKL
ncbi:MAG: hypothetical protein HQL39_04240 [Alphaproteobacteria bacterium]|nr:hypothetical protein [Alphaproteobacteria bacterium]